jgi:hypothetical protein
MERGRIAPWLVPSIGDILFFCILMRTLYLGGQLLNDGDTGWHIAAGNDILGSLSIPRADVYSHTVQGVPWISHEWLSEAVFALMHKLMGLNGVVLLTASVISLTMFFLYKFMVFRKVNPLLAALLTILAASASSSHWLARPHVFSLALTLAFVVILELFQREDINRLFLLPLLMAPWVNLHGGYVLGLILITIYAAGNLLSLTASGDRAETGRRLKALGLTLLAATLAACINPHGPAMLYYPFAQTGAAYNERIIEWASPDFRVERPFELMLFASIALFALSRKKPDFIEGASALLLTHMSLRSVRFVPLFAIIVAPMAAVRAGEVLTRLAENHGTNIMKIPAVFLERMAGRAESIEARFGSVVWVCLPVIFLFVIGLNGGTIGGRRVFDYKFNDRTFPVDALEFASKDGITGNMYNSYAWGGYIIYKGYPRYKVFVDGRADMYGTEFMKQYYKVAWAEPGFESVLDKYRVDWVIDGAGSPLVRALTARGGWKAVYTDKTAEILLRDKSQ